MPTIVPDGAVNVVPHDVPLDTTAIPEPDGYEGLPLNVFQSVLDKYPLVDVVDCVILVAASGVL